MLVTTSSCAETKREVAARARSGGVRAVTCNLISNGSQAEASSTRSVQRLFAEDALAVVWARLSQRPYL